MDYAADVGAYVVLVGMVLAFALGVIGGRQR